MRAAVRYFFSRKNTFLRNMLLSIVGMVCLPLIFVQLWVIHQASGEYKSSSAAAYVSALQANSNTYNMQLKILSDTAIHISQNSTVHAPLRNRENIYLQLQTVNQMGDYLSSTPFVSDIAVYYRPNGYVLSSKCKRPLADFCSYAAGNDSASAAQLYGFLDTVTTESYSAGYEASGYLIFAKPVSILSAAKQDAVICFLMKTDALAQTYEASLPYDAGFGILNRSGEPVVSSEDLPRGILSSEPLLSFLQDPEQASCQLTQEAQKLYLYKYKDPVSGNTLLACMGADAAEQTMVRYINRLHLTLVLSLVFMCLLLTATVYINYHPVKRLLSRHASDRDDSELSELELLDSLFFAKDERIASQNNLLSAFLISDLLFGVDMDPELLSTQFPADTWHHFAVASVSHISLSSAQTNSIATLLRSQITPVEFCTTRLPNSPRTLFIFMSGTPLNRPLLKDKLLFAVRKITGTDCTVQLGITVDRIEQLPNSHQSALAGMELLPQPDALPNENPGLMNEIQQFIRYITAGNQEQALASLEKTEGLLASDSVRENYRNYYCYKLLSAYLTAVNESQIPLSEQDLEPLLCFRSPVQLFVLLRQSAIEYCAKVRSSASSSNEQQQEKLRQYVNDNLTNSELCLTTAAEHMGLSIYAVSRLFKEATRKNFKEYVTLERLKMAYDLLLSTDQSISEIAGAVGFEDASYFSEVFKKHFHTVPSKLRSEARQK